MRDERIAPKGWPAQLRQRRLKKISRWHDDWVSRTEKRADFLPEGRKEGSDYNLHYVDLDAPLDALLDEGRRSREIYGLHPVNGGRIPEPALTERFRGALVGSSIGDAFGHAVGNAAVHEVSWEPDLNVRGDKALTEYALAVGSIEPTAVTQLLAFTAEGSIRAGVAERVPEKRQPLSVVQHAYQRWLHTQRIPWGQRGRWAMCGGPYAAGRQDPDGWLVNIPILYKNRSPNPQTVAALENFARTGVQPTGRNMVAHARGSDVVPRAALAAIWVDEAPLAFRMGASIAVLTHNSPDDCLAAGALAAILHQQIRDQPFYDCLNVAREELQRRSAGKRVLDKIDLALTMIQEHWVPAPVEKIRNPFGDGGADGAEALGLALYCAMASDYVREGLQLAMNYSKHRPVTGAITGLLVGAEYGVEAIPPDLRSTVPFTEVIDTLAKDACAEFDPTPPTTQAWFQRYPAW